MKNFNQYATFSTEIHLKTSANVDHLILASRRYDENRETSKKTSKLRVTGLCAGIHYSAIVLLQDPLNDQFNRKSARQWVKCYIRFCWYLGNIAANSLVKFQKYLTNHNNLDIVASRLRYLRREIWYKRSFRSGEMKRWYLESWYMVFNFHPDLFKGYHNLCRWYVTKVTLSAIG